MRPPAPASDGQPTTVVSTSVMLRRCSSRSTRARPGRPASSSTTSSGSSAAATGRSVSTSRSRAGSSTIPTRSGRASLAAAERRSRARLVCRVGARRDRHHEPARDDASSGSAVPASPVQRAIVWQDRRTAERCAELPADLAPRADRARARPVLLGDEARMAARRGSTAAARARVRHRRHVARLEAHRRRGARHRRDERVADDALSVWTRVDWDDELLALFGVERVFSPRSRRPAGSSARRQLLGASVPIAGIAGRSAGRALRAGVRRRRAGEGDVRDRQLRAREHGHRLQ